MAVRRLDDGSWENPAIHDVDPRLNIPRMLAKRAADHPGQIAVERQTGVGGWRPITIDEVVRTVEDVARGLIGLGLQAGDTFAILAPTSYEWAVLDVAALSCAAVTVPIYETDSAAQIRHILTDADVAMVVTATSQQAELVESVRPNSVRRVLCLDTGDGREILRASRSIAPVEVEERTRAVGLHDLATIIYTSGTTGQPKGVELTHGNFIESFVQAYDFLPEIINDPTSRSLLFLPVAHVLARFVMYALLTGQGTVAFSPNTRNLVSDIAAFRPTMLLVVPRVLETVYNLASAQASGRVARRMFSWASHQARQLSQATAVTGGDEADPGVPLGLRVRHEIADALVLRRVRAVLGPNLTTIISGGAPLATDLANFYRGLGVTLLQGYGLSETTGPISVEVPSDFPPDSVGFVWPGNRMRVDEDGELLVQGVSVTSGYHHLPEDTAEAFTDGWFRTGDLASIDDSGHLRITGRKKELIVTAGGKNVSPEILEDALQSHPLIGHVVVVGDARPYIAALITLDPEMLPLWLTAHHLPVVDTGRAAEMPEILDSLDRAIARANKQVSRAESIRRFRIVDAEFTVDNNYLTPSLKLKRTAVLRDFAPEIDAMYAQGEAENASSARQDRPR